MRVCVCAVIVSYFLPLGFECCMQHGYWETKAGATVRPVSLWAFANVAAVDLQLLGASEI